MLVQCQVCGEAVNNCCQAYHDLEPDHKATRQALRGLVEWVEDNFGEESYLEIDKNGQEIWLSYLDMDILKEARRVLE